MKICLTVHSSPWSSFKGGGQLAVHHLAQQLALIGHQIWVIYSIDNTLTDLALDVAYKVIWVKHIDVKALNLNTISVARTVYRLGKEVDLDVIHGNGEEAFFLPWVASLLKTKFICTTHAPTILDHGFFSSFSHPVKLLKELNLHLFRSTLKHCDCITTYSNYSYTMVQKALRNYPKEKIFHITPGVDHSWFEIVGENSQNMEYSIIFFGRIEYEKGVDTLIHAFKKVSKKYSRCLLHIVGEGNWEKKAVKLSHSLNLDKEIHFHGWKRLSDLQKMVGRSTLCILPSRVESFGLCIAEAMASSVPVISTRVAAVPEILIHKEHGLLVSANDSGALNDAILYAFDNKEKMEKMAERARQRIQSHFTWEKTAKEYLAIYERSRS